MKIRYYLLIGILWLSVNIFGQENKIESNGRVGIGTTNPDSRLHIYNDESPDSRFGLHVGKGQYGIKIFNGSTGNFFPVIAGRGNNSLSGLLIRGDLQATASKYPAILLRGANYDYSGGISSKQKIFEIQNYTSPLFTLLGSGNLGLGTTDPQGKLTVAAAGVNGILLSPDLTNQKRSSRLIFSDNLSSNAIFRYDNKLCFSSEATINSSSGNSKMVLTDEGEIGLGTTYPDSRLHIYNDDKADSRLGLHVGKGQFGVKIFNGSTGNFFPIIAGRGNNGLSGIVIRGDLQASASKYPAILMRGANHDYSAGISAKQKVFEIQNYTSPLFTLLGSGDLGIGTPQPQAKLHVSGTILANEIRVEAGGNTADFVFFDEYHLRDLNQVDAFIKKHRHLPDIPSAAEMEVSGVNLAEMNKLLLQKIEELTLYAIEKEEEVGNLEERVNQIEKILESIYMKGN